ncbi:MAG TPA: hypothetical protein VIM22_06335, partial [Solirubrobacteraceae bacterium]
MDLDREHAERATRPLGWTGRGLGGRPGSALGRAGCHGVRQLVSEIVHERPLELVERGAGRRSLHVEDPDHPIGDPKGDDEGGSHIRIGTLEARVVHRSGELHRLAALRDVPRDPFADALAVPEHTLRQTDGSPKVQLRSVDEHDRGPV